LGVLDLECLIKDGTNFVQGSDTSNPEILVIIPTHVRGSLFVRAENYLS